MNHDEKFPYSLEGDTIPSLDRDVVRASGPVTGPVAGPVTGPVADIEFQILDWRTYQEENLEGRKSFVIRLFGRTRDDKTIQVQVVRFTPYFFVEINKSWRQTQIDALMATVRAKVFPKENADGLLNYQVVSKYKFWGFTNYEKFNFLQLTFTNHEVFRSYERVFKKPLRVRQISNHDLKLQLYESNIEPFLRCMHIRGLDAVGWVRIPAGAYQVETSAEEASRCDLNISTEWTNLHKVDDRTILPFTIASFDIECTSGDGTFPQANRDEDKIIQIGTTFSRLGEDDCYFQHLITLGTCDPIPGVTVESYETEQEVLLAWSRLIQRTNPDVITGYNIFGFDMEYMKDRSTKLGVYEKFSRLSRIVNEPSKFKETKLASSALGDNLLKYFDMSGRVSIDLMKVVQRDHRLDSYKLDSVAANFIKEKIKRIVPSPAPGETTRIETDNTFGLKEDQFITIYYNDGITNNKHMDGAKFKILTLGKDSIVVRGVVDPTVMNAGYKVFWCQAKDDISPKDIFRLYRGDSKDRALVGRYCVQDCVLCNKLIAKLQVLINNIGMANVCNVPLSYLFMRGQGVKIFSLVAKKCREMQHLIPVLFKKFKTDEEKEKEAEEAEQMRFEKFIAKLNRPEGVDEDEYDDGYEGAIVFDPVTGVHYEPVAVLDYASLYPNSMREKNLSHECYVMDHVRFGDVPGYRYHVIQYTTGTITEPYEKAKLTTLLDAFRMDSDKYLIEELPVGNQLRRHVQVYDRDHNGKKRWLVTDVKVSVTEIVVTNYETSKFAEKEDGTKGIIPVILTDLLDARSLYKEKMNTEKDQFKKSVYEGLQLAYKVTANSLYGQTGSPVSPICMKQIAASTTATGRERLIFSRDFINNVYGTMINLALESRSRFSEYCATLFKGIHADKFRKPNKKKPEDGWTTRERFEELFYEKMNSLLRGKRVRPEVVYGDTDSVFFKLNITDVATGEVGKDRGALEIAIQLGIWGSHTICILLPNFQEQCYEKVLWPFMLLSKKRYVGNLYEKDPTKFYQKSMGIVLKRRDNANIVKVVCGGIVDQILNKQNPAGAVEFAKNTLRQILSGKFPMDKFVITKTLREEYKDRTRIVHAVLADRMAERDPGNKPLPNDRIPFVYVVTKNEVELQGERVETPDHVVAHNLKLDYLFYITNQIKKPAVQFLEQIAKNPETLFEEYIMIEENRRSGKKPIKSYFDAEERVRAEGSGDGENADGGEDDGNESRETFLDVEDPLTMGADSEEVPVKKRRAPAKRKARHVVDETATTDTDTDTFTLTM